MIRTTRRTGELRAGGQTLSKAVVSKEARRRFRYVELLSDAGIMLEDFFSVLLNLHGSEGRKWKNGAHQNS